MDILGVQFITLGGAYLCVGIGLAFALVLLGFEVYFHNKKEKNEVQDISGESSKDPEDKTTMQVGGRILTVSTKPIMTKEVKPMDKTRVIPQFD